MSAKFHFLHSSDICLDSSFAHLALHSRYCEMLRSELRMAFKRLVSYTAAREVSLLILAGNVVEGRELRRETRVFLREQFEELEARKIEVVLVPGSCDSFFEEAPRRIPFPDNVSVLTERKPYKVLADAEVIVARAGLPQSVFESEVLPSQGTVIGTAFVLEAERDAILARLGRECELKRLCYLALGGERVGRDFALSSVPCLFPGGIFPLFPNEHEPKSAIEGVVASGEVRWERKRLDNKHFQVKSLDISSFKAQEGLQGAVDAIRKQISDEHHLAMAKLELQGTRSFGIDAEALARGGSRELLWFGIEDRSEFTWGEPPVGEAGFSLSALYMQLLQKRWEAAQDRRVRATIETAFGLGKASLKGSGADRQ